MNNNEEVQPCNCLTDDDMLWNGTMHHDGTMHDGTMHEMQCTMVLCATVGCTTVRSTDLWVMGPARFHCATLLSSTEDCQQAATSRWITEI